MNRVQYMEELTRLLADIPAEEREDAINYYNDYFDEGGEENEEATIAPLGSPEQLAGTIKLANSSAQVIEGEFTEAGYQSDILRGANELDKYTQVSQSVPDKKNMSVGMIILIVILAIFALPILVPVALSILGIGIGLAAGLIGLVIGISAAVIACGIAAIIVGVVGSGVGFMLFPTSAVAATAMLGVSFVVLSFGILFMMGCINLVAKIVPPVIRGIVNIVKKVFGFIKKKVTKKEVEDNETV